MTPDLHVIRHSALDYQAFDSHLCLSPKVYSIGDKRILRINLESQAKLLGHKTVFLPSQCWCARFGELTAIHNIGRTIKKQHLVEVSLLFLSETVGKNPLNLNFISNWNMYMWYILYHIRWQWLKWSCLWSSGKRIF